MHKSTFTSSKKSGRHVIDTASFLTYDILKLNQKLILTNKQNFNTKNIQNKKSTEILDTGESLHTLYFMKHNVKNCNHLIRYNWRKNYETIIKIDYDLFSKSICCNNN
ncbi:hypothetical protein baBA2_000389 [Borrelia anserina]|uniref:hypothetical protein n=1 Tax=Borrelia anserina TaxID=143 RepID=UPI0012EB68C2|nr:hypothetical protein [Borrelia anserina]UPA06786.1 hypothetical protein baBA2_000389 [Borrelia anserina]